MRITLIFLAVLNIQYAYGSEYDKQCLKYQNQDNIKNGLFYFYTSKKSMKDGDPILFITIQELSDDDGKYLNRITINTNIKLCFAHQYNRLEVYYFGNTSFKFRNLKIESNNNKIYIDGKPINDIYDYFINKDGSVTERKNIMHFE